MESLSFAYGARDTRSFWRKHAIASAVTVLAAIFILAWFGVMALSHLGYENIPAIKALNLAHPVWQVGSWIVTVAILSVGRESDQFCAAGWEAPVALDDAGDSVRCACADRFVLGNESIR